MVMGALWLFMWLQSDLGINGKLTYRLMNPNVKISYHFLPQWCLEHFHFDMCFKFIECDLLSFPSQPDWSNNEILTLPLVNIYSFLQCIKMKKI